MVVSCVEDIMTKKVLTTDVSSSVLELTRLMSEKDVGSLIVLEKDNPAGIVTERDILKKVVAKGLDPGKVKAIEIMQKPIVTINLSSSIFEAVEVMNANKIRRLPVVEDGKLRGIITLLDVMKHYREIGCAIDDLVSTISRIYERPIDIST